MSGSLPLPLLTTSPAHQKVIHRIVYHSITSVPDPAKQLVPASTPIHCRRTLSLEVTLEEPKPERNEHVSDILDDFLDAMPRAEEEVSISRSASSVETAETQVSSPILSSSRCWTAFQAATNVMMPDR